jgi:hypothetical protein
MCRRKTCLRSHSPKTCGPSCKDCNSNKFSKDDEYFRFALTIVENAKGHPDRDAVVPKVLRGLKRPEAARFRRFIDQNTFPAERFTPNGLYLGRGQAIRIEGERLNRTAARITKGLFFRVKGYRLPDDHNVNALQVSRFPDA